MPHPSILSRARLALAIAAWLWLGARVAHAADDDGDGWEDDVDCDDQDRAVYPGALDVCDAIDNDCDGATDESDDIRLEADIFGDWCHGLENATWYFEGEVTDGMTLSEDALFWSLKATGSGCGELDASFDALETVGDGFTPGGASCAVQCDPVPYQRCWNYGWCQPRTAGTAVLEASLTEDGEIVFSRSFELVVEDAGFVIDRENFARYSLNDFDESDGIRGRMIAGQPREGIVRVLDNCADDFRLRVSGLDGVWVSGNKWGWLPTEDDIGVHTASFELSDDEGNVDVVEATVTVVPAPPPADGCGCRGLAMPRVGGLAWSLAVWALLVRRRR